MSLLREIADDIVTGTASPRFHRPPQIAFHSESEQCPGCGAELYVRKTDIRQVVTLHIGAFVACESIMQCRNCDLGPFHSAELAELVPQGCNFGYDVMIRAGRSLLLEHRTAEETTVALSMHNVAVSASEVRELAARFVTYLGIAHLLAAPAVSKLLNLNGGYILHLDSTSRKQSRKMLTNIDELTGLVLLNIKLSTETAEDVAAFLRNIVGRYGLPLAVGCDMAAAIRSALRIVLPSVPVYICHFHFLRDAGNDMMKKQYRRFSKVLDNHELSGKFRKLRKTFDPFLSAHAEPMEQFLAEIDGTSRAAEQVSDIPYEALLAGLLHSTLEAERQGDGFSFPFDRPKLHFYKHLLQVHRAVKAVRQEATCRLQEKLADKLLRPLDALASDSTLAELAACIDRNAQIFDQMRTILRIAVPGSNGGLDNPDQPINMPSVKEEFTAFRNRLENDNVVSAHQEIVKLIEQIDRHWHGLFRKPIQVIADDGNPRTIQPQRTNNIMEHFFRDHARHERRRIGTDLTARRLNAMLPDTPLVRNLKNTSYMDILLNGADTLEQRFSTIDASEVRASLAAARAAGKVFSHPRRACKILRRITTPLHFAIDALKQTIRRLKSEEIPKSNPILCQ